MSLRFLLKNCRFKFLPLGVALVFVGTVIFIFAGLDASPVEQLEPLEQTGPSQADRLQRHSYEDMSPDSAGPLTSFRIASTTECQVVHRIEPRLLRMHANSAFGTDVSGVGERTLYVFSADGPLSTLLDVSQLPTTTPNGFNITAHGFSSAALSPDRRLLAFATDGFHAWVGLLDLRSGNICQVMFLFEGAATGITWSPDGLYLAFVKTGGIGVSGIVVLAVMPDDNDQDEEELQVGWVDLAEVYEALDQDHWVDKFNPEWGEDGIHFLFSSQPTGAPEATRWMVDIPTGRVVPQGRECQWFCVNRCG